MFSRTDAEALQVHAVFVVKHLVESVAQLRPQLLASSALKLGGRIGRTSDGRGKEANQHVIILTFHDHWGVLETHLRADTTPPPSGKASIKTLP